MNKSSQAEKDKGKKYVESFLKEDGVKSTTSGLAYKIVKAGSAKKPSPQDTVEVHYHGTLIDGKVFDSSVDRGEKISFPLNGVIPGWTEGLQLIGEGGEVRLVIPSELAYGDRGSPPVIPGGATLIFNVSLFRINPK
ncbi:MAG: FKBP-type peptidyl-prolyl cis-trans isomerase [Deltaproteobacteria bacterium]|nr:FKBP-type peptidyl-prolyl cis-trans isomerase [Deltaproteobacteria bacterium]